MTKKIICLLVCILVLFTTAGATFSPNVEVSVKSTGRIYSHSILGEFGTYKTVQPSKKAHAALKNLYAAGYHPFYYISMIYDKNKHAEQRMKDELGLQVSPTVFWDGGYRTDEGATSVQDAMSKYNTSIIKCGNRNVADIDLDVDVEWAGAVNPVPDNGETKAPIEQGLCWNISAMDIDVTVDNNEDSQYDGHLHVYVTEINSSVWEDAGGHPYTFAFLDYAWNENISISSGSIWNDSIEWDGWDHDDGHGHNFYWIEQDNIMVIASVFDEEYTDETTGFVAGVGTDPKIFDVYFGDSTPLPKVASNITNMGYEPPGNLEFNTTYYWKVDVWDNQGDPIYGDIWSFTTRDNNPPYEPSDPTPPDGATNEPINTTLSWECSDPNGDDVTYDVYFGGASPPPKVKSNQTGTTFKPGILDFDTEYEWIIVAWDEYGLSTSGKEWSFITEKNSPPYEPSSPHPPDGGTIVPVNITLCWEGGDPNPGDSVTYDVYLGSSYPPHNLVSNNQSETCYNATGLELNETYYWKIAAWDSQGLSTDGQIWNFTTGINHPPDAPIIEEKNIVSMPIPAPIGTYNYTFKTTDPDGHDIYYWIEWGDGTHEGWIGPYSSGEKITRNHTWIKGGTYVIRAKAKDIYDAEGPWGRLVIRSQISHQSSSILSGQESKLQNKEMDSLLSLYGLDTEDTVGEFEQLLYNLASKRWWRNPRLANKLRSDIDELSDILEQIGVKDDMTIAEALPVIENNKDQLQEKGINLFCSMDIFLEGGGCIPLHRLFKAVYGWWVISVWRTNGRRGYGHVTIKGLTGVQNCKDWECKQDWSGRFIGMTDVPFVGFNPPVIWVEGSPGCLKTQIKGDLTLFSRSDVLFVNSSDGSQQSPCSCNQEDNQHVHMKNSCQNIYISSCILE